MHYKNRDAKSLFHFTDSLLRVLAVVVAIVTEPVLIIHLCLHQAIFRTYHLSHHGLAEYSSLLNILPGNRLALCGCSQGT